MSTQVELSEMETTRAEKFLAFVLAVFLLIGGLWVYFQPLDRGTDDFVNVEAVGSASDRAAVARHQRAEVATARAERAVEVRRDRLELAREDYRTSLDAERPDPALRARFERTRDSLATAEDRLRDARAQERALAPAADEASDRLQAAEERAFAAAEERQKDRDRETFLLRLGWVLLTTAAAFWLFNRQRRRRSRYLPIGMAAVGAATAQAVVMATDYLTDYFDVTDLGPLELSLAGVTFSVLAFIGLQRYLAKRVPQRRVRKGECPFCGYPVRANQHCEGCGRDVILACSSCNEPRRVGTEFCGACGNA